MADQPEKPFQRFNAPRGLNVALGRLTKPLVKQRGAVFGDILSRWPEIVGPMLSPDTQPERLIYGARDGHGATLEVGVNGAQALELQHLAPLVIERINSYFGYRVVAGLKLKQMPIRPKRSQVRPSRIPQQLGRRRLPGWRNCSLQSRIRTSAKRLNSWPISSEARLAAPYWRQIPVDKRRVGLKAHRLNP